MNKGEYTENFLHHTQNSKKEKKNGGVNLKAVTRIKEELVKKLIQLKNAFPDRIRIRIRFPLPEKLMCGSQFCEQLYIILPCHSLVEAKEGKRSTDRGERTDEWATVTSVQYPRFGHSLPSCPYEAGGEKREGRGKYGGRRGE